MSNVKKPQMKEELITDMQFAGVAESLRRVCFFYGNRYVEEKDEKSHNNSTAAQVNEDPEHKIYMYQLPNTDAGPYDSARVSPSVLTAFAEDMMIIPHLLHQDEVHQAVILALDRRRKRAHLRAVAEKTLYDFISVCANKLMEKRPYCNIYSTATIHEKVRALIDFISVDYGQVVFDVLDSRFTPINEVHALQDAVQAETQRRKKREQKYKTIDAARVGVSELWTHIHEIFLFFCETPLCALSDAEKHVKTEPEKVEQSKTVTTENSEDLQLTCKKSTVQVTVDIEKVNIESVLQFHPSIKKANLFFSARRIQRWYRHKLAEFQQRFIRSAVVSATVSTKPLQPLPRPPCGPTVMSLLPRVHVLTSKYSLSPHPQSHARVNLELLEGDGAENEESAKLPALTVPPLMITRPVHQIIEWKRLIVEECDKGSEASSQSSASVIGISEIPLYNDRLGVWTKHTALLKKPLKLNFKGCTSAVIGQGSLATYNQAATGTRPGTAKTRINQGTVGATSENLNVFTPRIVGVGDRRKIEYEHWPNTSRSQYELIKVWA